MSDFNAFIRAICSNPADDTPRLVMADWLEENGQEERAEFIRVQCELAGVEACNSAGAWQVCNNVPECRSCRLRRREDELVRLGAMVNVLGIDRSKWSDGIMPTLMIKRQYYTNGNSRSYYFATRGFVSALTCTAADWLKHADEVYWHPGQGLCYPLRDGRVTGISRPCPDTAQPLTRVVLTTMLPLVDSERLGRRYGEAAEEFMSRLWPGIEFELPAGGFGVQTNPDDVRRAWEMILHPFDVIG